MTTLLKSEITAIGPEVADLAEGGVLILFADGAPPELAEVSVLHRVLEQSASGEPAPGSTVSFGNVSVKVTAVGPLAWAKVREMGHVVISFNGATTAERPGEISVEVLEAATLVAALTSGTVISVVA